jgi:phosphotransferase system enzyme I (PtsI)
MKVTERIIQGASASPGVAIGRAVLAFDPLLIAFNFKLRSDKAGPEVERFRGSVRKSREQLRRMQAQLRRTSGTESSFLIDAHLLILQDPLFVDRIVEKIQTEHINAEWAIQQVSEELFEAYDRLQDDYLRERRGDLDDIVRRLLHNLQTVRIPSARLPYDTILVGKSIPPSTLFELRTKRIAGLVTETGSFLSHTAIMARSLEIPAVMGVQDLSSIASGDLIIIDAHHGSVLCNPSEATLAGYRERAKVERKPRRRSYKALPTDTEDHVRIVLAANINFSDEVKSAVAEGCESIGLYRTEFDFFRDGKEPDEQSLIADYSAALRHAGNIPLTFRTIDIGIDHKSWDGVNSSLGVRGLRFCLENQEIFRTQLRAIYRSSIHGRTRLLLPFVSNIDDLDAARTIIEDVRLELTRRRQAFDASVPIGVMIETPAAAQTCDLMASRVDFFCLGTNDLIQYYLVIDRSDQSVAHLYNPFHPAILRCLHQVYTLLQPTGKPITVCGEMAGDPLAAAVLLGLGFRSLSVSLAAYAGIKRSIRSMSIARLEQMASDILKMEGSREIEQLIRSSVGLR